MVRANEEVRDFLDKIQEALKQSFENLIINKKTKGKDKNREFQIEYGIGHNRICEEILRLDITNYSETDEDDGAGWTGEVWIFGQIVEVAQNQYMEIYIKLKLRNKIICLSFHPKEFDLKYPYN
jgi:hypothetical protein